MTSHCCKLESCSDTGVITNVDFPRFRGPTTQCHYNGFGEAKGSVEGGTSGSGRMTTKGSVNIGEEFGIKPASSRMRAIFSNEESTA